MIYETCHLLNIFTKGTLNHTLALRSHRLVLALLIREHIDVLEAAARGGKWKPDLLMMTFYLTPKLLEMTVLLPDMCFALVFWFFGLYPRDGVMSPAQFDLMEGRKTIVLGNLKELVEVSYP
ncbi:hypothetical protein EON65_32565 [archaeon]|nr:MAG: hypothetical protein EON65_32565 [archaeon]